MFMNGFDELMVYEPKKFSTFLRDTKGKGARDCSAQGPGISVGGPASYASGVMYS